MVLNLCEQHAVSDTRLGSVLAAAFVGVAVACVNDGASGVENYRAAGASLGAWALLWALCYWDNSRGELAPRWRALGVGPIGSIDAYMFRFVTLAFASSMVDVY